MSPLEYIFNAMSKVCHIVSNFVLSPFTQFIWTLKVHEIHLSTYDIIIAVIKIYIPAVM